MISPYAGEQQQLDSGSWKKVKQKSKAADKSVRPTQNKTDLRRGPFPNTELVRLRSRRNYRFWRRTRNTLNFFLRVAFRAGGSRLANVDAAFEERAVLD